MNNRVLRFIDGGENTPRRPLGLKPKSGADLPGVSFKDLPGTKLSEKEPQPDKDILTRALEKQDENAKAKQEEDTNFVETAMTEMIKGIDLGEDLENINTAFRNPKLILDVYHNQFGDGAIQDCAICLTALSKSNMATSADILPVIIKLLPGILAVWKQASVKMTPEENQSVQTQVQAVINQHYVINEDKPTVLKPETSVEDRLARQVRTPFKPVDGVEPNRLFASRQNEFAVLQKNTVLDLDSATVDANTEALLAFHEIYHDNERFATDLLGLVLDGTDAVGKFGSFDDNGLGNKMDMVQAIKDIQVYAENTISTSMQYSPRSLLVHAKPIILFMLENHYSMTELAEVLMTLRLMAKESKLS